jgi:hypothetical protein
MKKIFLFISIGLILVGIIGLVMNWSNPTCGFMESHLPCSSLEATLEFYLTLPFLVGFILWPWGCLAIAIGFGIYYIFTNNKNKRAPTPPRNNNN